MRKLILFILFIIAYYFSFGQYPLNQSLGSDSTLVTSKGGLKSRLVNYVYADTATANTERISQYPFAQIAAGTTMYYRNSTATAWVEFGSGSGGGSWEASMAISPDINNSYISNFNNQAWNLQSIADFTIHSDGGGTTRLKLSADESNLFAPNGTIGFSATNDSILFIDNNNIVTDPTGWLMPIKTVTGGIGYLDYNSFGALLPLQDTGTATGDIFGDINGYVFLLHNDEDAQSEGYGYMEIGHFYYYGEGGVQSYNELYIDNDRIGLGAQRFDAAAGAYVANSLLYVYPDSIFFRPDRGKLDIDTLNTINDLDPVNVMVWDTTTGRVKVTPVGNLPLTAGGSNTQVQYNNSGVLGGVSGATSDGTNVTFGSNNLRATFPRINSMNDASGNEWITTEVSFGAVNYLQIGNAATGESPRISVGGDDPNIGLNFLTKAAGYYDFHGNSTQAATIRLYEDTDNGTNYTSFNVGIQAANITYTLPTAAPAGDGYSLTSTTAGVMSWTNVSGSGGLTVGTTAIASGTPYRLLFEDGSNVLNQSANIVTNAAGELLLGGQADAGAYDLQVNNNIFLDGSSIKLTSTANTRIDYNGNAIYAFGNTQVAFGVGASTFMMDIRSTGVGIGGSFAPSNPLHVLSTTTPQVRFAYDGSNYYTSAVSSAGAITFDATGASAGFTFSDAVTFSSTARLFGYTVATLPAAGTAGRTAYVTDATAPTYLGALVGGGAVVTPVFDNGSAWVSY